MVPLDMTTVWSQGQGHEFRIPNRVTEFGVPTTQTTSNAVTVQVGGTLGSETTPGMKIFLKSLCVELH